MSASFLPRGTQFMRSPDGVTYTKIAEAKKITQSRKGDFLDATNMDTPTAFKEWTPGMIDGGSVKVDANFINTDAIQNDLENDFAAQTLLFWRIQLPNTRGKYEFQGYVEELSPDFDVEKLASQSISVKTTGQTVWTPNV